jgi:hypothetical protein
VDYSYELLGDERFQELCQALLLEEYPGLSCYPAGQPDGGRDAVSRDGPGMLVFQIKFVKKPDKGQEVVEWLETIVEGEIKKVQRLASRGLKQYVIVTNVRGTSHLDVGTMDRLHAILEKFPVPANCLWRDDLNRRLENAWQLKWMYAELMTGPDLIHAIIESGLGDEKERRTATIRAFVKDQFTRDAEVKFKQVDLQNKLFDLFIDVPLEYVDSKERRNSTTAREINRTILELSRGSPGETIDSDEVQFLQDQATIGAATLFLSNKGQKILRRVVLEGAPGQGKSTITQYVCQIHRARVLHLKDELSIHESFKHTATRLPFRIDLRDLAGWLDRIDPFAENAPASDGWAKSLESFLAAQIRYHSGGADFSISDLFSVFRISPILLVFDGLDEVAKIKQRNDVVEEIAAGVKRLEANCENIQVIVTSRPAAFANSPGMPRAIFEYFHLSELPRPLIDLYAEKWTTARRLSPTEVRDVKSILRDRLDAPHLRDLARNPMQLAILLSLIHQRGASLPDKRTALYDSYVDLFFNRESEKSRVVRENRDLLIRFHQYLAWTLHSRAEVGKGRGSITSTELSSLLDSYLSKEDNDTSKTSDLFNGIIERVVAIVSRVQGTYEFEVQPLREYFAARHLYETAPYSPPGNERRGTKVDRFDAIARNPYWLNVARFYAGCYSVGELPSLIDGLKSIFEDSNYKMLAHPRNLAAMLLSDWVFTQHPRSVKEVLSLVIDNGGLRYYLASNSGRRAPTSSLVLPRDAGRQLLVEKAFAALQAGTSIDTAFGLIELLQANSAESDIKELWLSEAKRKTGSSKSEWLTYGALLGYLGREDLQVLDNLFGNEPIDSIRLGLLLGAKRSDWIEADPSRFDRCLRQLLNSSSLYYTDRKGKRLIDALGAALNIEPLSFIFRYAESGIMAEAIRINSPFGYPDIASIETPRSQEFSNGWSLLDSINRQFDRPISDWKSSIEPWSAMVEAIRTVYGDNDKTQIIANLAAAVRSPTSQFSEASQIFDTDLPLCHRIRYARLRSGQPAWWARQLSIASCTNEQLLVLQLLVTWGSQNTLTACIDAINSAVVSLHQDDWYKLNSLVLRISRAVRGMHASNRLRIEPISDNVDDKTQVLLSCRWSESDHTNLYRKRIRGYRGKDCQILEFGYTRALDELFSDEASESVDFIEFCQENGTIRGGAYYRHRMAFPDKYPHNLDVARRVLARASKYPAFLVSMAEETVRSELLTRITPVNNIAKTQKWFSR